MSFPLITVGIITYNASETVNKAIQSALSQSWRSIEIIIIDDCSTDDTFKKINSFAINNRKISVFRNNNNYGVGFSRNRVIKEAKGEFVVFFIMTFKVRDNLIAYLSRILKKSVKFQ